MEFPPPTRHYETADTGCSAALGRAERTDARAAATRGSGINECLSARAEQDERDTVCDLAPVRLLIDGRSIQPVLGVVCAGKEKWTGRPGQCDTVDDLFFGNADGVSEENRNAARRAALPETAPGATINLLCS
ncbi:MULTISPECIES: hypothetical protein [Streptomyces]|uniref:hypothetical protein n=1 Tax=Streptomyces TaxID=1883 RepID=UPI000A38BCE9